MAGHQSPKLIRSQEDSWRTAAVLLKSTQEADTFIALETLGC